MDYEFVIGDALATIPGGTGILLLHLSIGETDRIDTDFFKVDTDRFFVISTRTTACEVEQRLEHYEVDESSATTLDTLSIERGYSRRSSENIHYVAAPDDLDAIVEKTRQFLERHDGKLRLSVDSVTEMAYYVDEDHAFEATKQILELLDEFGVVRLFHLSREVHDRETPDRFRELFDGIVDLNEDGTVTTEF